MQSVLYAIARPSVTRVVQSKTVDQSYYDGLIGSRICTFDWHHGRWPWM